MDIRQHAQWQEVLEDIKSMTDRVLQSSRQGHYRLYKWRSSYIIEEIATENTVLLRTELKQVIDQLTHLSAIDYNTIEVADSCLRQ